MRVEDYKKILENSNESVREFIGSAMIDELRYVHDVFNNGMSLMDWENLQYAIEEIEEEMGE